MANLKELRTRINSVKSTEKITSAMKMVAASRLRRAQQLIGKSSPYYNNLLVVATRLMSSMIEDAKSTENIFTLPALCQGTGNHDKYLLVIFASDRGLCGSYNYNVVKEAMKRIEELKKSGKEVKVFCIGRKSKEILKRKYADYIIESIEGVASKGAVYSETNQIFDKIQTRVEEEKFDVCELVYSKFHSAINREIVAEQIFPLILPDIEEDVEHLADDRIDGAYYEYEPKGEILLNTILMMYMKATFFHAMVDSQASEQGARMTSMDGATRNAKDMISKLTLRYNQLRQTAITTELTEIISGAEAI